MTEIRPEICHEFIPLTHKEIAEAHENHTTVTGFVESIITSEEIIEVRLGNGIIGILPFSEVTIYPLRYSTKRNSCLPTNIRCLSARKIRVKITKISADKIILSRKQNMLEAFCELHTKKTASMYITEVIEKSAFGDIGEGLTGKMLVNEVCRTHIRHVGQRITTGKIIEVAILGVDNEMRFAASYRQTFKPYRKEDYPIGTTLTGIVGDWIKVAATSKYYTEVTPQVPAILTVYNHPKLEYGSKVECVVTGSNDKGLFLELSDNG